MDRELVEKHLTHIVDQVELLRRFGRPERLDEDPVQLGFVAHTLQTAVQAAIDVAVVVVAERRLGEPRSNRQMFEKLASDGWIRLSRWIFGSGSSASATQSCTGTWTSIPESCAGSSRTISTIWSRSRERSAIGWCSEASSG